MIGGIIMAKEKGDLFWHKVLSFIALTAVFGPLGTLFWFLVILPMKGD